MLFHVFIYSIILKAYLFSLILLSTQRKVVRARGFITYSILTAIFHHTPSYSFIHHTSYSSLSHVPLSHPMPQYLGSSLSHLRGVQRRITTPESSRLDVFSISSVLSQALLPCHIQIITYLFVLSIPLKLHSPSLPSPVEKVSEGERTDWIFSFICTS